MVQPKVRQQQRFFRENTFALQQLFAAPVTYVGEQISVKLPTVHNAGQRQPDFLLVNTIVRTVHLVEIKTPDTALMASSAFRGSEGAEVYATHRKLAESVAQIQGQIQSARADLPALLANSPGFPEVDAGIVRGSLIAGRLDTLRLAQQQSFLRFRDGLIGIDILTYDEVLQRLRALHAMLKPGNLVQA